MTALIHVATRLIVATALLVPGLPTTRCSRAATVPADLVLTGGRIYTAAEDAPWAEAVAIREGRFVFVGTDEDANDHVGEETVRADLGGHLVIPGLIDAHTHPGLVAILRGDDKPPIPGKSLEDIQAWLRKLVAETDAPVILAGGWPTALFGPTGPRKEWLDAVAPDRAVTLFDVSGHSMWFNSRGLEVWGITAETPDPAGPSELVRDPDGELTGWVKEFAAVPFARPFLVPEQAELERELERFVNFLVDHGVTSLVDAGNLEYDDDVYRVVAKLERTGRLPLRYEGSYHVFLPGQINGAIDKVKRLRREYGGERLTFNTIKIHLDGILEIRTAALLEPYSDDPDNRGETLLTAERIAKLLVDMQGEGMHLHVHTIGDRATRVALDGVAEAQERVGGALDSRVTLSHIEIIAPEDVTRFEKLGVLANFTPHWHGEFGRKIPTSAAPLGPERSSRKYSARIFHDAGARVTYSSDVTNIPSSGRANPYLGIQTGHTRQEARLGLEAPISPPLDQRLTLDQLLAGYTRHAAFQQGWEERLGSIEPGKEADLVVLDQDLFQVEPYEIAKTRPTLVLLDGTVVRGELPRSKAPTSSEDGAPEKAPATVSP